MYKTSKMMKKSLPTIGLMANVESAITYNPGSTKNLIVQIKLGVNCTRVRHSTSWSSEPTIITSAKVEQVRSTQTTS